MGCNSNSREVAKNAKTAWCTLADPTALLHFYFYVAHSERVTLNARLALDG